jgi:hypothetical protein
MGQLDMARQGQDFNQMLGLEGIDFRNRSYNDQMQMYQDQMLMQALGQNPIPVGSQANPYGMAQQMYGSRQPGIMSYLF